MVSRKFLDDFIKYPPTNRFGKPLRILFVSNEIIEDLIECSQNGTEKKIIKKDLIYKIKIFLNEKQRQVIEGYYFDGLTMRQIGQIVGVSEARVSQIRSRAIKDLKEGFCDQDM